MGFGRGAGSVLASLAALAAFFAIHSSNGLCSTIGTAATRARELGVIPNWMRTATYRFHAASALRQPIGSADPERV